MRHAAPLLFGLGHYRPLAERVAAELGVALALHEERAFADGEQEARPSTAVRGGDVYVIESLASDESGSLHDRLCRLLFFLAALRDAGARRVTAVAPYLCYQRKERRTKPRDPVSTRYLAQLLEAVGIDRVVAVDVHDVAAFENAFRCPAEHLEARSVLVGHVAALVGERPVSIVSPDAGGFKRADRFRRSLGRRVEGEVGMVFLEKVRTETGIVGGAVVGEVEGRVAVVVDDLIATGSTIVRAARACRERGATEVLVAATHGLFTGGAGELFAEPGLTRVVVTDSVLAAALESETARGKLTVAALAPLLARAIERLHDDGSLSDLAEI